MNSFKKINGLVYFLVFGCLLLHFIDNAIHTSFFTFISATSYWNFAASVFFIFFLLSILSLFNKELVFKYVPYIFYVLFIVITVGSFLLNFNEDIRN